MMDDIGRRAREPLLRHMLSLSFVSQVSQNIKVTRARDLHVRLPDHNACLLTLLVQCLGIKQKPIEGFSVTSEHAD